MYVGIFLVVWAVLMFIWVLVRSDLDLSDVVFFAIPSLALSLIIFMVNSSVDSEKDFQKCLETSKPIMPKVVYLSDSTEKIFKYSFETDLREIHVKNTEPYFHVPESLIFVEPCSGELILKDVQ